MAERPLPYEDQDEVALAKGRTLKRQTVDWEVPSTDDDIGERVGPGEESIHHGRHSPVPSVISMKSDWSMDRHIELTGGHEGIRIDLDKPESLSSRSSAYEQDSTPDASCQHTTEPGRILCAVCPKRASKSCLTCMASFCEVHVKQHYTAPALQRHKLVEATEDLQQKLCTRHNRELELYCRTDQTAICVLCMAVEHNGHDITELGEHQRIQMNKSEMEKKTDVPPPGPIEFTSVKPDSVCVCWGPPEGLTGPHRFRVSWTGEGNKGQLEVQDLKLHVQELTPGEKYTFTVATLSDDGRQSPRVSATVRTDIPPPVCLTVDVHLTSVSVIWSKPAGVGQATYLLTLCSDGKCLQTTSTKSLHCRFSEFEMERRYTISVSTVLKEGQSKPISKTIRTSIPVPEKLTVSSVTPTSADLRWRLHQGMEQIPHSFLISYHSEGTEPQTISTESCSTTLTDLQPVTQYTVTVRCEGGRSQATLKFQTGIPVPESLSVDLDLKSGDSKCVRWRADLSWSLHQGMEQIPHYFQISYHSEGTEPQKIRSGESCITLTDLEPDTQYTVNICTVLQSEKGEKGKPVSTIFHTSERRIVLLGKTGDGKSSAGNTILGEELFEVKVSLGGVTNQCETQSKIIHRKYTVIDTPGFFDTSVPKESLNGDIAKCIFDSAPGPHAFIIVLRVGRYSIQFNSIQKTLFVPKGQLKTDT